jgi:hypothetical protein
MVFVYHHDVDCVAVTMVTYKNRRKGIFDYFEPGRSQQDQQCREDTRWQILVAERLGMESMNIKKWQQMLATLPSNRRADQNSPPLAAYPPNERYIRCSTLRHPQLSDRVKIGATGMAPAGTNFSAWL